ncbi:hypothetical protein GMRT_12090 [Giardia muris]|uniref:FHA domain-containing protein n=1 Tax=Giardia muris TaxID=5742 RepID=A0A4Z1SZG3_GIAMU|nr:hypothetical protein GMRT_12090 [Giardia muris]|eukprot:TNJ27043.1 hypothetical protein GMRT_12090 [Giardia muris]
MNKCTVYQDGNLIQSYDIAVSDIIVGRATKDGSAPKVEEGTLFIPLPGPAISSRHLTINLGDTVTVTDSSRTGSVVQHGGESHDLHNTSHTFAAGPQFVIVCVSKNIEFRLIFANESEQKNQLTEIPASAPEPKRKTATQKAKVSKTSTDEKASKRTKTTAVKEKPVKEKATKPRTRKVAEVCDAEPTPPEPQNESFHEFSGVDDDDDENESLQIDDTEEEIEEEEEKPEELSEEGEAFADVPLDSADIPVPTAYDLEEYTRRRAQMPTCRGDGISLKSALEELGPAARCCWCNYLRSELKETVSELSIHADEGYAFERVDVFFTNKFRRTARYLLAIHRGIPIIREEYLIRCQKTVLRDSELPFPHAAKYLLRPTREEAAQNDPELLKVLPNDWSLPRVIARARKYPVVITCAESVLIAPEAIIGHPMERKSLVDDLVTLYSFALLTAGMGVTRTTILLPEEFDRAVCSESFYEAFPEAHRRPARQFHPCARLSTLEERILEAAGPAGEEGTPTLLIVPDPSSPHYEPYSSFKGVVDGRTFIQMTRAGIVHSVLLGEPVFEAHFIQ